MKLIFFLYLFLASTICWSQEETKVHKVNDKNSQSFDNTFYEVHGKDVEMLEAIEMAKKTFSDFEKALKNSVTKK